MTDPQTSATEAGRRLADLLARGDLWEERHALILAIEAEARASLDVDALGFTDLLDIGGALLAHYPPDTIVCSHSVKADPGAQTAAAIADVIASCRALLAEQKP